MNKVKKYATLFSVGGAVYYLIEVLWRLHKGTMANPLMFIVGGQAFILIGLINVWFSWDTPLIQQCLIGGLFVTGIEFVSGCILNLWLGLGIWDYSTMPLNLLGQICLPFSIAWCFLSLIGILLDDYIRYYFFDGRKPEYKLI